MAPHGDAIVSTYSRLNPHNNNDNHNSCGNFSKPPRLSSDNLQRTRSDISFELSRASEAIEEIAAVAGELPPISEVEDTKCECCNMSEECTPEYIERVRAKFSGKWICGLCSEAVKEEVGKNGGKSEEALITHMKACARFKSLRASPLLFQADAMRQILKKSTARAKSLSPRDKELGLKGKPGGITRSSSCIPAMITREMNDLKLG